MSYRIRCVAAVVTGLLLAAVAIVATGSRVVCAGPGAKRAFTLIYTSQAYGSIRSCNCSKFRYGGYSRQATWVKELRKASPDTVVVEGGDMMPGADSPLEASRGRVIAECLRIMDYAAVVPGESDITSNLTNLKTSAGKSTEFVSANVTATVAGKPKVQPFSVRKLPGGVRVGITGVVDNRLLQAELLPKAGVAVTDPIAAAKKIVPQIRKKADVVVLIAHCPPELAKKIAAVAGIDVVICTHVTRNVIMPKTGNELEAPTERIGRTLYLESGTRSTWSVGRLDLVLDAKNTVEESTNRLVYLGRECEEDAEVVALYNTYNTEIREIVLEQRQKMRAKTDARVRAMGVDPDKLRRKTDYLGSEACKSCHEDAYKTWSESTHSKAFATLVSRGQEYDPDCVSCHVTGAHTIGGFVNAKETPERTNVQCESCHGPGRQHIAKTNQPYGAAGEEGCRGCHTDSINPDFDYEPRWKKIAH